MHSLIHTVGLNMLNRSFKELCLYAYFAGLGWFGFCLFNMDVCVLAICAYRRGIVFHTRLQTSHADARALAVS